MNKKALLAAGLALSIATCPALADDDDDDNNGKRQRYQTANVFDALPPPAGNPDRRLGAAWLVRSKNHVRGRIMSLVPTPGDPYTLWIVVFNNPSACSNVPVPGCDATDLGNPAVRGIVFNGTGAISPSDGFGGGVFNVDFEIKTGKLPNGLFVLFPFDTRTGISRGNGFKAEIHLIVDQHPNIVPGTMSWIPDLTTTNFPGAGDAFSVAVAIFVPCPGKTCPASVL